MATRRNPFSSSPLTWSAAWCAVLALGPAADARAFVEDAYERMEQVAEAYQHMTKDERARHRDVVVVVAIAEQLGLMEHTVSAASQLPSGDVIEARASARSYRWPVGVCCGIPSLPCSVAGCALGGAMGSLFIAAGPLGLIPVFLGLTFGAGIPLWPAHAAFQAVVNAQRGALLAEVVADLRRQGAVTAPTANRPTIARDGHLPLASLRSQRLLPGTAGDDEGMHDIPGRPSRVVPDLRVDLDGDGKPERVRLDRDGVLSAFLLETGYHEIKLRLSSIGDPTDPNHRSAEWSWDSDAPPLTIAPKGQCVNPTDHVLRTFAAVPNVRAWDLPDILIELDPGCGASDRRVVYLIDLHGAIPENRDPFGPVVFPAPVSDPVVAPNGDVLYRFRECRYPTVMDDHHLYNTEAHILRDFDVEVRLSRFNTYFNVDTRRETRALGPCAAADRGFHPAVEMEGPDYPPPSPRAPLPAPPPVRRP